ncbi:hypothetical protein Tco_0183881 [Tanacetum coccineum]
MLAIFHDMIEESVEVFMDDFSVFGNSFDKCLNNLDKMFQRCKDAHLILNWEKCHFMVKEGIVLGHKVFGAGLEVDKSKIDVISKLLPPTNIKEFDIEIRVKKGTENIVVDHLSRIDNDETSDDSEVDDNFPGETLMEINTRDEPWIPTSSKYVPMRPKEKDTQVPQSSVPSDSRNVADETVNEEPMFVEKEVPVEEVVSAAEEIVNAATINEDEITLAQALAELKSVKPKVTIATTATTKGILLQEPSESITTIIPSKDKGKGIMVEEPLKMKKKDQISFDEQEAIRLQAEFDEEVRLAREKDEANVALIEEWNDIQAKIDADYQLAQRLQAQEQEELTIEERAKLFQQLLEKRRKHFAAKRAEEKRNRPPTKAQQRSIMCTYLKNMAGWKPKDLKNKSFDSIQKLFDKAMKRVNTFVAMDIELVESSEVRAKAEIAQESSSKRAGEDLQQESTKKQKIDDVKEIAEVDEDKETAELQSLMKVIPDEEEVVVDVIPLATKPLSIVEFKILKEGKLSYFQIIRADRSSKSFLSSSKNNSRINEVFGSILLGRIVGIKRLLDDLRVTAVKLMLLVQNLLLLVLKVNDAGMKVTTAERLQLLKEFMLTEKRPKTYQRKYKDFLKIKIT